MHTIARKNVALLVESSRSYGRRLLQGIARFSRTTDNWSLFHEEMTIDAALPDWLSETRIDGVIARLDDHIIQPLSQLNVPIVDVRCRKQYPEIPQIETDDQLVAELAFQHLPGISMAVASKPVAARAASAFSRRSASLSNLGNMQYV